MTQNLFNLVFKNCENKMKKNFFDIVSFNKYSGNLNIILETKNFLPIKKKNIVFTLSEEVKVFFIISIAFTLSNTFLSLITPSGKVFFTISAGLLGLKGKQKTNRLMVIKKFLMTLINVCPFLIEFGPEVALHLRNTGSHKVLIMKTLKFFFLITSVKTIDLKAYNGCRKKKKRRKKLNFNLFK